MCRAPVPAPRCSLQQPGQSQQGRPGCLVPACSPAPAPAPALSPQLGADPPRWSRSYKSRLRAGPATRSSSAAGIAPPALLGPALTGARCLQQPQHCDSPRAGYGCAPADARAGRGLLRHLGAIGERGGREREWWCVTWAKRFGWVSL